MPRATSRERRIDAAESVLVVGRRHEASCLDRPEGVARARRFERLDSPLVIASADDEAHFPDVWFVGVLRHAVHVDLAKHAAREQHADVGVPDRLEHVLARIPFLKGGRQLADARVGQIRAQQRDIAEAAEPQQAGPDNQIRHGTDGCCADKGKHDARGRK